MSRAHRRFAFSGLAGLAFVLGGCGSIGPPAAGSETFAPPPPLSVVVIIDPSPDRVAAECQQLEAVLQARVTASETLVLSPISTNPLATRYVVRRGDSLDSIAADQGVSLAALEAANPQLGPVAGRDWNRIYPRDQVTIPGGQPAGLPANLIVTRAPRGPAPPILVRQPQRPSKATSFQEAQYSRELAAARSVNRDRVSAWNARVASELHPWLAQVAAQLHGIASRPDVAGFTGSPGRPDLSASVQVATTTLEGLPGRRVLLVLGSAQGGPPTTAMRGGSLAGVRLVVANLADVTAAAAWRGWAGQAGASAATTLDPALTQLQLASAVND
jgi:LysM repeat protein